MWGDKQKTEEEKKAEVKPAEQSKQEADDLITRMSATFAETIKPLQEKINSYETRFQTIEEATKKPERKPAEERQFTDIFDNPDQAIAERLMPTNAAIIQLNARITEDAVYRDMDAKGWGAYIPKVKESLDKTDLVTKGQPTYESYVRNVVTMVVGREAMEKGLRFDSGKQSFFMEDANGHVDSSSSNAKYAKLMEMAQDGRIPVVKGSSVEDVIQFLDKKLGIKDVDAFLKAAS